MRIIAKRPFDVEKANAGRIALGVWLIDVAAFLAAMFGALIPPAIKRDLRAYLRSVAYQAKRLMLLRAYQLLKTPGRRRQTLRPASAAPGFRVRKRRASALAGASPARPPS